jgi:ElaA protein
MNLNFSIKNFNELTVHELYAILKLRAEVFVVEQNCVYQDIDGKDEKALHIVGVCENKIVAYARIFNRGDYFDQASIGRVVINKNCRDNKWGYKLMNEAITAIKNHYNETNITISAQFYLKHFYEQNGFVAIGDTYLEDNIPHIEMRRG